MTWGDFIRSAPVLVGGAVAVAFAALIAWDALTAWREKRR